MVKIGEQYDVLGKRDELASWVPAPRDHIYMFNTPDVFNECFLNQDYRIIVNFRDPRDLVCNQYHWVFQHPMIGKTDDEIHEFREKVKLDGINEFVLRRDISNLFTSAKKLNNRIVSDKQDLTVISYSQLCSDFDNMVIKLASFFDLEVDQIPWDKLEAERTEKLDSNPNWIGKMWSGADVFPGRHKLELTPDTIEKLNKKYYFTLKFLEQIEAEEFKFQLHVQPRPVNPDQVVVGKDNVLFLRNDSNNTIAQITGSMEISDSLLTSIALKHLSREVYGKLVGNFVYCHGIIPSKEVAVRAFLPESLAFESHGKRPISKYMTSNAVKIWQPFYDASLFDSPQGDEYFPKGDSHWNHKGALLYMYSFLSKVAPEKAKMLDEFELREFSSSQTGDLGQKIDLEPDEIKIIAPQTRNAFQVFENDIPNEGKVRYFRNRNPDVRGKLICLHDSFTMWLLDWLAELYSEVLFVHTTIFDYAFIDEFEPTAVFCLQAERFLIREPSNGESLLDFIKKQEDEKGAKIRFDQSIFRSQ
jgi:hypothetical protein